MYSCSRDLPGINRMEWKVSGSFKEWQIVYFSFVDFREEWDERGALKIESYLSELSKTKVTSLVLIFARPTDCLGISVLMLTLCSCLPCTCCNTSVNLRWRKPPNQKMLNQINKRKNLFVREKRQKKSYAGFRSWNWSSQVSRSSSGRENKTQHFQTKLLLSFLFLFLPQIFNLYPTKLLATKAFIHFSNLKPVSVLSENRLRSSLNLWLHSRETITFSN